MPERDCQNKAWYHVTIADFVWRLFKRARALPEHTGHPMEPQPCPLQMARQTEHPRFIAETGGGMPEFGE